jgi:hypothetical protein
MVARIASSTQQVCGEKFGFLTVWLVLVFEGCQNWPEHEFTTDTFAQVVPSEIKIVSNCADCRAVGFRHLKVP